jgi:lipopolysaccharide transport system ATP-binding protein
MSEMAIRVDALGKVYRMGERRALSDLRETVTDALRRSSAFRKGKSGELWALKDVSFEVDRGEVVGILGDNGSGKTTLLKVLGQITSPTKGRAELCGRVGALLDVAAGLHGELTGRENIYLSGAISGMSKMEMRRSFDQIVEFAELEVFMDTPLKRYSSGMCVRLAFSVIAHLACDVFLVDEVLAVGDVPFQRKCMHRMMESVRLGRSIMFVSHDLDYLRQFCTRILVFAAGRIVFDGAPAAALSYYSSISTRQEMPLVLAH